MVYSASVFGITGYFSSEATRMRHDIKRMMIDERHKIEENIEDEEEETQ